MNHASLLRISAAIAIGSLTALAQPQGKAGEVVWKPTKFETTEGRKQTVDAEEGRLLVEENWDKPSGRLIALRLVRFRSTSATPGHPVVYLAGGPGGSGILSASGDRFPLFMALRAAGDVIALDQRGVRSDPFPVCRDRLTVAFDRPSSVESFLAVLGPASKSCAERWAKDGIDLSAYHTNASADDLEALRKAIGAPKLQLLGISYGTHLALAALKKHPQSIERVVLAGTEGPDHSLKLPSLVDAHFRRVIEMAQADPDIRRAVPDLLGGLRGLLDRLTAQQVTVATRAPNGDQVSLTVGPLDLQLAMWENSNERDDIAELPARAAQILKGDLTPLAQFAGTRRSMSGFPTMSYTMDCASGASPERLARVREEAKTALLGNAANLPFPEVCAFWPHVDLGAGFRAPVRSDTPALFISGTVDGRTPPENAEEVMKGFSAARHVRIVNGGHDDDLLIASPAINETIVRFLQGQAPASDRIDLGPIRFRAPR